MENPVTEIKLSAEQMIGALRNLSDIEARVCCFLGELNASGNGDSQIAQKMLNIQCHLSDLVKRVQPAILFEDDTAVDSPVAAVASN